MSNVNNVTSTKPKASGAIRVAKYGTALPTSTSDTLSDDWKTLGYISEDGYTNGNSITTTTVKDWGGNPVLDGESEKTDTIKVKLIEALNEDVQKFVYCEENVTVAEDGSMTVHANDREHEKQSIVIDEVLKDGRKCRTVAANATLTALDDIEHKAGSALGYGVTISMKKDEKHKVTDDNGDEYIDTHVTYYSAPATATTS